MSSDLESQLIRHEGLRLKPYRDTAGKLTIGVGRNLDDVGISGAEAMALLAADVERAQAGLNARLPWWRGLDPVRADAVTDMAFNLGVSKLCGFATMLDALKDKRWDAAADAMSASLWARQVGARAVELARQVRTGAR